MASNAIIVLVCVYLWACWYMLEARFGDWGGIVSGWPYPSACRWARSRGSLSETCTTQFRFALFRVMFSGGILYLLPSPCWRMKWSRVCPEKHFSSSLLFSSASRPLHRCNLARILHATLFDPDDISWRMYFWTFPRMNNIPAIKWNPSIFNPPSPCDCWGQACQMVAQPMDARNGGG